MPVLRREGPESRGVVKVSWEGVATRGVVNLEPLAKDFAIVHEGPQAARIRKDALELGLVEAWEVSAENRGVVLEKLRGELLWARGALQPHARGSSVVETVWGSTKTGDGSVDEYFRLYPDGTVEKGERTFTTKSVVGRLPETHFLSVEKWVRLDSSGRVSSDFKSVMMPKSELS